MIPENEKNEEWATTERHDMEFDLDTISPSEHQWEPEPSGMRCVSPGHHHGVVLKTNQEAYKDAKGQIQIRQRTR